MKENKHKFKLKNSHKLVQCKLKCNIRIEEIVLHVILTFQPKTKEFCIHCLQTLSAPKTANCVAKM